MVHRSGHRHGWRQSWLCLLLLPLLNACGSLPATRGEVDGAPDRPINLASIADAVPRPEPRSKYGNPASYEVAGKRYQVMATSEGYVARGIASWYGTKFHGKRTSSGEPYDMYAMSAAHRELPIPCYAEVTNLRNGRKVVVKINDRGPFHANRIIDLSYAAAAKLDILGQGTGLVEVRVIDTAQPEPQQAQNNTADMGSRPVDIYLQAGAFADRSNAEKLREKLATLSSARQVLINSAIAESTHQPIYRVRIGPFASPTEVDYFSAQLSSLGFGDLHIVLD